MAPPGKDASGGGVEEDKAGKASGYAWAALAVLVLVSVSNQWSRFLVNYFVNFGVEATPEAAKQFMNIGIGFDEAAYGLLSSFGFTLLYSALSLVAGRVVDVVSKKTAIVASCLAWSVVTAAQALANSFPALFGLRVLLGSAQAFTNPASYTLLADIFPASVRGTANSIFSSGVYLGGALASLSIILNGMIGWRSSSLVVGGVGVAVALAALLVLNEDDGAAPKESGEAAAATTTTTTVAGTGETQSGSFRGSLRTVFASRTAVLLFASAAARFCAGYGIGTWVGAYFQGAYPEHVSEFSVLNAFVVAGGGLLSSLVGGYISDSLAPRDPRVRVWVPMVGCLLAVPCWMGVVSGASFYVSMAFLLAEYLVAECWFGPTVTVLQGTLPSSVRGVGQGVFSTLVAVGTLAPPVMGALVSSGLELRDVLFWAVPLCYVVSAALFFATGESLRADFDAEKAD